MQIQYQNTFEEYLEASTALAARKKNKPRRSQALTIAIFIYLLLILALSKLFFGLISLTTALQLFLPFPLIVLAVLFVQLPMSFIRKRAKVVDRRPAIILAILILLLIGAAMLLILNISGSTNPQFYSRDWYLTLLAPHATWIFMLAAAQFASQKHKQLRKMWDQQPTLHRAKTAEIVAEGITINDGVSRLEYRWEYFIGWSETKNIFVLLPSEFQVIFLPKKAFASEEELNAMRAMAGQIPNNAVSAFQVVPASFPPPLPDRSSVEKASISSER